MVSRIAIALFVCLGLTRQGAVAAPAEDSRNVLSVYAGVADVYERQTGSRNGPATRLSAYRRISGPILVGGSAGYYRLGSDLTGCDSESDPDCPLTYDYDAWEFSIAGRMQANLTHQIRSYVTAGPGLYSLGFRSQIEGMHLARSTELGFSFAAGVYGFWLARLGVEAQWHSVRDTGGVLEGPGTTFYALLIGINLEP